MGIGDDMIEESYLIKLIRECNELRKNTGFVKLNTDTLKISYMSKKNQEFIGYLQGYYEMFRRKKYKINESDSLRANCKKYLKIFREKDGTVRQIENYVNGRIDVIHQAFTAQNKFYLFPYTAIGGSYPTYTYVTVYSDSGISEEYMVNRNQIVYMKYEPVGNDNEIAYSSVNYVEGGKYPVLEKRKGIIRLDTLQYDETEYSSWLDNKLPN